MARKPKKFHLQVKGSKVRQALCKTPTVNLVDDINDADCTRCIVIQQCNQPRSEGRLVDVVVTEIGPMVIPFIRALRETSMFINADDRRALPEAFQERGFGLKEAKDFADAVRHGGKEQRLLHIIDKQTAFKFQRHLEAAGAKVDVRDEEGRNINTPNRGTETGSPLPITTAYREMLRLFLPEEHTSKYSSLNEYLDQFDDDEKTGHRHFPHQKTPRIADIRRWLAAGGIQ